MTRKLNLRIAIWFVVALILVSSMRAVAAGNSVPSTRLARQTSSINANALKPAQCAALNLTAVFYCTGGNCNATTAAELVIGTANADSINGRQGSDCILGGGGNDSLTGGAGTDVCIGGPGTDTFNNNCETRVQ